MAIGDDSIDWTTIGHRLEALEALAKYAQEKSHKVINLTFPQGMCFLIRTL